MTGKDGMSGDDDFEIERVRAEVLQEKQMQEMLEQSLNELQITVDELDKRMDTIDEESNEWKTRYENQTEMNQQLQKQIFLLQDKVEDARRTFKESKQQKGSKGQGGQDTGEVTPYVLKTLQKEKDSLDKASRDLEWRLDQESKAYHKANEERKQFVLEINAAKDAINELKVRQRFLGVTQSDAHTLTPRGNQNIAADQRILDPRKGPIKKTAAVKSLPRISD